ncbi:P-loop containing nucleoside triphosphate hydrolase protein [Mycena galericulata]|nr:P-loop containing nucleoside triphosphate hydrolase protein [Mycena galericulata]
MPFTPLVDLDPERLEAAYRNLCTVFGVPSLHSHQKETGQNVLKGITTFLDIPTGGGKTLAYWLPLFYYWSPGNIEDDCQKIILVVGPLSALMQSQASSLMEKGVPAVALTSQSENPEQLLKASIEDMIRTVPDYRIVLVSPEMAVTSKFHEKVLSSKAFADNIISQVIDEGHCISEWGNDDFRPEFSDLYILLGRLPSRLPIVIGSATMPRDVILDIQEKLRLRWDCARVSVSNEKLNIALSVRIMQHPQDTFADLMTLFPRDATCPADFPQSLIYANGLMDVEKIQDFLRRNSPEHIDPEVFEFYHRFIAEKRKALIQERIASGVLREMATTDALGMGMDFQRIMRVILWHSPLSFLSLVQKIGRCVRLAELLGEAILYITGSAFIRYEIELDILKDDIAEDGTDADDLELPVEQLADGEQMDRDAAVETHDEMEEQAVPKRKRKKVMSAMEARDRRFLLEYIVTKACRRLPWNKFFGNDSKLTLPYPVPPGARCCDNCTLDLFPIETVRLTGGSQLKSGRRRHAKVSEELVQEAQQTLRTLRDDIARREFPNGYLITGKILMSDVVVEALASRVRDITSVDAIVRTVRWHWAPKYGAEVVTAVQLLLVRHPDLELQAREERDRERSFAALQALAEADLHSKLVVVFDACHEVILSQTRPGPKVGETVKRCQRFIALPRKTTWSYYYDIIEEPISMAQIKKYSHNKQLVRSTTEYAALWHRLFNNARQFNIPGSPIYQDAEFLHDLLDKTLEDLATQHGVPGPSVIPQQRQF